MPLTRPPQQHSFFLFLFLFFFKGGWWMAQLPASSACLLALSLNACTTVGADADDRALGWL